MIKENCGFDHTADGDTLLVRLKGEIDHHSAVSLRGGVDALIYEKRPARLLLELSAVGFMDSSGLGFIMGRYSLMKSLGGRTLILDPSPQTVRILELAGIRRIVPIEYSGDETEKRKESSK